MFQKSKYLLIGLVTGALAANPIELVVNGQDIQCDVSPQNINGRVLVPARFVAESLGANVLIGKQDIFIPKDDSIIYNEIVYVNNKYYVD